MIKGAWLEVSRYWLLGSHSPKEKVSVEHDFVETTLVKLIYTHLEVYSPQGLMPGPSSLTRGTLFPNQGVKKVVRVAELAFRSGGAANLCTSI